MTAITLDIDNFFVLRTPLLSIRTAREIGSRLRQDPPDYDGLCENAFFMESLWLASQRMYLLIRERRLHEMPEALLTIERYVLRMAYRATPFGLFAGVSTGRIGNDTVLSIPESSLARRHVQIDAGCVAEIESRVRNEFAALLSYQWNDTLIETGNSLYFVGEEDNGQHRSSSSYLLRGARFLIEIANHLPAPFSINALREAIASAKPQWSPEKTNHCCTVLSRAGAIVPMFRLRSTGNDRFGNFVAQIPANITSLSPLRNDLARVETALRAASCDLGHNALPHYELAATALREHAPSQAQKNSVHVTLVKDAPSLVLGEKDARELSQGIAQLLKVSDGRSVPLISFTERFVARFGQQEVPLLIAVDRDLGVGFGFQAFEADHLIGTTAFLREPPSSRPLTLDAENSRLLRLIVQSAVAPGNVLEIEPTLLGGCLTKGIAQHTVTIVGQAFALDASERKGTWQFHARAVVGPSALRWLGRFGEADPILQSNMQRTARSEDEYAGDAIVADIVYPCAGRDRNVVGHGSIRQYEIDCFGGSGLDDAHRIALSDLTVRVVHGEVRLFSRRLGRRVIPSATHAHATRRIHHPPVYQFLGAVSRQSPQVGLPSFQSTLRTLGFLPRITCGRIILNPGTWLVDGDAWRGFGDRCAGGNVDEIRAYLRAQLGLPRFVAVVEEEGNLELDIDDDRHIQLLADKADSAPDLTLVESLSQIAESPVRDTTDAGYAHEFLLPVVVGGTAPAPTATPSIRLPHRSRDALKAALSTSGRRELSNTAIDNGIRHSPSTQWLYLKLPCGRAMANDLLLQCIAPAVEIGEQDAGVDRWFFIRYDDDAPHLRLRLRGDPGRLMEQWLPQFRDRLREHTGHLPDFSIDTYTPESGRYGGTIGLEFAEILFWLDSRHALRVLGRVSPDSLDAPATDIVLASVDNLLGSLGMSLEKKYLTMTEHCAKYYREFSVTGRRKLHVDANYRRLSKVSRVLPAISRGLPDVAVVAKADWIGKRNVELREALAQAAPNVRAWPNSPDFARCIGSYIHMSCNRLFASNRRLREMLICDALRRAYESSLARSDTTASAAPNPIFHTALHTNPDRETT
ncbi:lantibiotic dehydratase [Burkholderia contaminans]|uniref:lantibiotic dehydratase n=1 Tax=Burkholderia contaminans TaxID=488447 RepID=UPI001454AAB4|nr:lantibiotic dehydratase [Burkholderia contaminans]MCA8157818.1 lantibiotic dehydratase [Burkholderia contaminans]VWD59929.1 Nisin biosynthesis protein NisB [Burkholderia contaminans]